MIQFAGGAERRFSTCAPIASLQLRRSRRSCRGDRFTSVPAVSCEEAAVNDPRADLPPAESPAPTPARILIADDEAASRKLLALTLKAFGYEVRTATNGAEAVEMAAAEPPDILLLDFQMPELNGVEVCAALRNHEDAALREIPIIMLTAHDGEDAEVAGLQAGANDFEADPVARVARRAVSDAASLGHSIPRANSRRELARWRECGGPRSCAARAARDLPRPEKRPVGVRAHYGPMVRWAAISVSRPARRRHDLAGRHRARRGGGAAPLAAFFSTRRSPPDDPLAVLVQ